MEKDSPLATLGIEGHDVNARHPEVTAARDYDINTAGHVG